MKMVKSLLLGSAAGVVAVATGQAADLPVKAKPVEYVKVCSLYGAGFFYIPGTDKCIKIGGYLREQYDIHGAGDGLVYMDTTNGTWTRGNTSDSSFRTRSVISVDVREQSSFGTIRAYTAFGGQQTTPNDINSALYFTRSFVQFAGFTIGRAVSFFDFFSTDPYALLSNIRSNLGNTGATGINVFAYTAQLGNGLSATLSAEDACAELGGANNGTTAGGQGAGRKCLVVNTSVAAALSPGTNTTADAGYRIPDIVGALRADQAWGSAQLMGGLHSVKASYYGSSVATELQNNGHPDDKWGWAAGAGFQLKNFLGMQGDTFGRAGELRGWRHKLPHRCWLWRGGRLQWRRQRARQQHRLRKRERRRLHQRHVGHLLDRQLNRADDRLDCWRRHRAPVEPAVEVVGLRWLQQVHLQRHRGQLHLQRLVLGWLGTRYESWCGITGVDRHVGQLTVELRSEPVVLVGGHPHTVEPELEPRSRCRRRVEPPEFGQLRRVQLRDDDLRRPSGWRVQHLQLRHHHRGDPRSVQLPALIV